MVVSKLGSPSSNRETAQQINKTVSDLYYKSFIVSLCMWVRVCVCAFTLTLCTTTSSVLVDGVAVVERRSLAVNFACPALDLHLTSDHLYG